MRLFTSILTIALVCLVFSCKKEEEKATTKNDYSQLGIETIELCNNMVFTVNNSLLLDLSGNEQITISSTSGGNSETSLTYACFLKTGETPAVGIKCKYTDTSVVIDKSVKDGLDIFNVTVTRPSYTCRVVYTFYFKKLV